MCIYIHGIQYYYYLRDLAPFGKIFVLYLGVAMLPSLFGFWCWALMMVHELHLYIHTLHRLEFLGRGSIA